MKRDATCRLAQSPHKSHAVIVLPPGRGGSIERRQHRKWLSRGHCRAAGLPQEMLARVLEAIGQRMPASGLAALRFWGQTGERSAAWMAAADPVHLEPRLNHLLLHALRSDDISAAELRELFARLQEITGADQRFTFARLGPLAYLRCDEPIATAAVSPEVVDGREAHEFMPSGEGARGHDQLLGELQMALHDHEVNRNRAADGKRVVNSIWLWGGGTAPVAAARPIPAVFSDDPLFRGYWASRTGIGNSWTEDFDKALSIAPEGFVAVSPDAADSFHRQAMTERLEKLRTILKRGDLARLTLLFRDGLSVGLERSSMFRLWRKVSPLLEEQARDE